MDVIYDVNNSKEYLEDNLQLFKERLGDEGDFEELNKKDNHYEESIRG